MIFTHKYLPNGVLEIKEGELVSLDIAALQRCFGDSLAFTHIVKDELYNDEDESCAFSEEGEIYVDQLGEALLTFKNLNGDHAIFFTLTKEEAAVALFPELFGRVDCKEVEKLPEHEIVVRELLEKHVFTEAKTPAEAFETVKAQYRNGDIIIGENDIVKTEFFIADCSYVSDVKYHKPVDLTGVFSIQEIAAGLNNMTDDNFYEVFDMFAGILGLDSDFLNDGFFEWLKEKLSRAQIDAAEKEAMF